MHTNFSVYTIGTKITCLNWRVFFVDCSSAGPSETHINRYTRWCSSRESLLVDSWRRAAAAAAITLLCSCCRWKLRIYVGFRAYFLKPSGASGKFHVKIPYPCQNLKRPYLIVVSCNRYSRCPFVSNFHARSKCILRNGQIWMESQ